MAKFTPYIVASLPTSSIDKNGLYFKKGPSETKFTVHIRKDNNAEWVDLGTVSGIDSINGITTKTAQLELSLSGGSLSITGGQTPINLDSRYALDSAVVKLTGNQSIAGVKTFTSSPVVPDGTSAGHAVNKGQVDAGINDLQAQISALETTVSSGLKYKGDIDASTSPNYPAAEVGDTYFISVAGKIGGSSGVDVNVMAMIVCKADTAAGNQATVGDNWSVLQSDLDYATESVAGFIQLATQAEVNAGTNSTKAITPSTIQAKLNALGVSLDGKYVRYDASQSLTTPQKTQARANIDAALDSEVVKLAGAQTITGVKTFSASPIVPTASSGGQPVNLTQMNNVTEGKFVRYDNASQGLNSTQKGNARTNIDAASIADVQWGAKEW